jgi:hypothetical protein
MRLQLSAHATAGTLFLLAASFPAGIWFIYLFVAMPYPNSAFDSAMSQLQYTFSPENGDRLWFAWLAALPFACIALGVAYLLNVSRSRPAALIMLATSGALAVATFVLTAWPLALLVALPMAWGYRCLHAT